VKDLLKSKLDQMIESWKSAQGSNPKMPWDPDIDQRIYVGDADEEDWIEWKPLPKDDSRRLADIAPDLAPFLPSLEHYFADWWFLSLEGKLSGHMLSLVPNRPGVDPDAFLDSVRRHRAGSSTGLQFTPIGIDNASSLQVVISNGDGRIFIDDWERNEQSLIASSLDDLLQRLIV
jgi:SecY interacting protein Syd